MKARGALVFASRLCSYYGMCRVNIRPDIAFYSAMEGTTGQVLKEENDPGLGRRLLYNIKLTVYYRITWKGMT